MPPVPPPRHQPRLNLGIVAHVDAGKTTLTERLLHHAGVIDHLGRVDHGDTVTDADAIERRRGITIRSAVVGLTLPSTEPDEPDGVRVNLIDTPGHSDFVAEVERALAVLDGAVLVVSAVEGVQAQTRVLIRILERLRLPFLVFANKTDRAGASYDGTLAALRETVAGGVVATRAGIEEMVETLTTYDERLLNDYVVGRPLDRPGVLASLGTLARRGVVHPVVFGSALNGQGLDEVVSAIPAYLPRARGEADSPLHGAVFKIERDSVGHRIAHARLDAGSLTSRDTVTLHRREPAGVTARPARALEVRTYDHGSTPAPTTGPRAAGPGDIVAISGLGEVRVGDQLGGWDPARAGRHFPDPGLESVVEARDPAQRIALFRALRELAEEDPLIDARLDGPRQEVTVTVYGEVQKEVIAERLAEQYGVVADFLPTRVVHVERVSGVGEALTSTGNVMVGLRLSPAPPGSGLDYALAPGVERGWLLPHYHRAVEEQLSAELAVGLRGWRIADLSVRLVQSRWIAPVPSPSDFRRVTSAVFRRALTEAGTVVCAPVSRFELDLPAESLSTVLTALVAAGATAEPVATGPTSRIVGTMPSAHVAAFEHRVPGYTSGRGTFTSEPAGYR